jgi:ribosomal protein S5
VIVGRDGIVTDTFVGFGDDSAQQIDAAIDKALAAK